MQQKIEILSVHIAQHGESVNKNETIKDIYGWGEAHPLTGLMYCADCGGKMYVHRTYNGKRIPQYTCGQYGKTPVGTLCPARLYNRFKPFLCLFIIINNIANAIPIYFFIPVFMSVGKIKKVNYIIIIFRKVRISIHFFNAVSK